MRGILFIETLIIIPSNVPTFQAGIIVFVVIPRPIDPGRYVTPLQGLQGRVQITKKISAGWTNLKQDSYPRREP